MRPNVSIGDILRRVPSCGVRGSAARLSLCAAAVLTGVAQSSCMQSEEEAVGDVYDVSAVALSAMPVPTVCGTPQALNSYAIYANSYVTIGKKSTVTGSVGVRHVAPFPSTQNAQLVVRDGAKVLNGNAVSPDIRLGTTAQVPGSFTDDIDNSGDHGDLRPFPSNMPTAPSGPATITPGTTNVTILANGTRTELVSASYGAVVVRGGAAWTLRAGTYNIQSLTLAKDARLYVDGSVVLNVVGTIELGIGTIVGPAPGFDTGTAKDLRINTNATPGLVSSSMGVTTEKAVIDLAERAQLRALVVAPNGSVQVGAGAKFTGSAAVDHFDVNGPKNPGLNEVKAGEVVYEDGFDYAGCSDACPGMRTAVNMDTLLGATNWFNNENYVAAGDYLVKYEGGCMKYNGQQWWAVNAQFGLYSWYLVTDPRTEPLTALPGREGFYMSNMPVNQPPGVKPGIEDFNECVRENKKEPAIAVHHDGGPLGIWLKDRPYSDNSGGNPPPTWSVSRIADHGQCLQ